MLQMRLIQQQDDQISPRFFNTNWLLSDHLSPFNDSSSLQNRPLLLFEVFKDNVEEYLELCVIQVSVYYFCFDMLLILICC